MTATFRGSVRLDGGQTVRIVENRGCACRSVTTDDHGEEYECWREAGHEGLHVEPVFDFLGNVEHDSPLWTWREIVHV
jgi:hypothetical protein